VTLARESDRALVTETTGTLTTADALLHVVREMRESLVEADLLDRAAYALQRAVPCDWTLVLTWDPVSAAFRGAAGAGWQPAFEEQLPVVEFRPDTVPVLLKLVEGVPVRALKPPAGMRGLCRQWRVSAFLAWPMRRSDTLVGAIFAGFRRRQGPLRASQENLVREVAEHLAVAIERARALESERRNSRLKTDILATISHELRTPINAILGYADLMRDGAMGPINAEQAQALDRVLFNGRSIMEMIAMALDLNRLEAGRLSTHVSEFRLHEVLAELSHEFAARPISKTVRVSWPEHSETPTLWADRAMLKVAVRNLVNNAIKFTPQGSVAVAVDCNRAHGRVRISVSDTGVGIPRDQQASIFDMFSQVGQPKASVRGGVGLGLYLVRSYTELMGGTVSVESTPGKGSTFTVELPWNRQASSSTPAG
jgi:signal transduction histidine kinase